MDNGNASRISTRTAILHDEIRLIREQERQYRRMKWHTDADTMAHASRGLRLITISEEVGQLRKEIGEGSETAECE